MKLSNHKKSGSLRQDLSALRVFTSALLLASIFVIAFFQNSATGQTIIRARQKSENDGVVEMRTEIHVIDLGSEQLHFKAKVKPHSHRDSPIQELNVFSFDNQNSFAVSNYWIGASCQALPDYVREHLKIPSGLLVQSIANPSPAKRGLMRKNDIIIEFGDEKVASIPQLSYAIEQAKNSEVKVKIIRHGESRLLKIKPEKRKLAGERVIDKQIRVALRDSDDADQQRISIERALKRVDLKNPTENVQVYLFKPAILIRSEKVELDFDTAKAKNNNVATSFEKFIQKDKFRFEFIIRRDGKSIEWTSKDPKKWSTAFDWGKCILKIDERPVNFFPRSPVVIQSYQFRSPKNGKTHFNKIYKPTPIESLDFEIPDLPSTLPAKTVPKRIIEKIQRFKKVELGENVEQLEKFERSEKVQRFEKFERIERSEKKFNQDR